MANSTSAISKSVVLEMINAGMNMAEVGRALHRSRERIRQIVAEKISDEELRVPCGFCGKVLPASMARVGRRMHETCRIEYRRQCARDERRRRAAEPREHPRDEFEAEAVIEYARHNCRVLWMPIQCPFDYLVNGHRVEVKGSRLGSAGRWQFEVARHQGRCDILHCVALGAGKCRHYFIPVEVLGGRVIIALSPSSQSTQWLAFEDRWDLLDK